MKWILRHNPDWISRQNLNILCERYEIRGEGARGKITYCYIAGVGGLNFDFQRYVICVSFLTFGSRMSIFIRVGETTKGVVNTLDWIEHI